jgi:hypothetical protein
MIGNFLAKLLEKLPLQKLSSRMAYALTFNTMLLLFMTVLFMTETRFNGFPNAWDYRMMLIVNFAVFLLGLWDVFRHKR